MGRTTTAHTKEYIRIKQTLTDLSDSAIIRIVSQSNGYWRWFETYFPSVTSAACHSASTYIMGPDASSATDLP